jgi:hypothetical protein
MDLLWAILTLPYAPVRGLTALLKTLERQAWRELYDPAKIRRELEELEEAAATGQISEADWARAEQEILDRLIARPEPGAQAGPVSDRGAR